MSRRSPQPTASIAVVDTDAFYPTKNDLSEATRIEVATLFNTWLADAIDLQAQCKQAHWNVKGPNFIALHTLFDQISESAEGYVDLIAERIVQLGGVAEGTVQTAAARTRLPDYPLRVVHAQTHVAALSDALAAFGHQVRIGIAELVELEDAGSADLLTSVSRSVDKWLWFVEAHQQEATIAPVGAG
jgi:starvation-inducible DNA-binding protein